MALLIITAVAAMYKVRNRIGKDSLRQNHEVAGFIYAVVGSIFAVNIALVVDTAHDEFILSEKQVAHEVAQIGSLYHLAEWFDKENNKVFQQELKQYLRLVIHDEWPRMSKSKERSSPMVTGQIGKLLDTSRNLKIENPNQQVAYSEIIHHLSELQNTRELRLYSEQGNIPLGLSIIVIFGGIVIIGFSLLLAMDNHRMQGIFVAVISVLIWSNIMLAFSVRYPFNGIYSIPPRAFIELLNTLK